MEIGLPLCSKKSGGKSLVDPGYLVNKNRLFREIKEDTRLENLLFVYDKKVFETFRKEFRDCFFKQGYNFSLLVRKNSAETGIVWPYGIGAPNHCLILEEFIAIGVKRSVIVGRAGGISENLAPGDIVVCTGAYKDEGTSYHYENTSRKSLPDYEVLESLMKIFPQSRSGDSWSTDAPYRETIEDVLFYRKKKTLTVDMEASAHFTVSRFRKVASGAVFVISDVFSHGDEASWSEEFSGKTLKKGLLDASRKVYQLLCS